MSDIRAIPRRAFLAGVTVSGLAALLGFRQSRGESGSAPEGSGRTQSSFIEPFPRTIMLDQVTVSVFVPHLGERFSLEGAPEGVADLELFRAEKSSFGSLADGPTSGFRESFSLMFLGPEGIPLPQGMYTLTHPSLGTFSLFLVPMGPGRQSPRLRYEAIFG